MNEKVELALDALDFGITHRTQSHWDLRYVALIRDYIREIEKDWEDDVKTMESLAEKIESQGVYSLAEPDYDVEKAIRVIENSSKRKEHGKAKDAIREQVARLTEELATANSVVIDSQETILFQKDERDQLQAEVKRLKDSGDNLLNELSLSYESGCVNARIRLRKTINKKG